MRQKKIYIPPSIKEAGYTVEEAVSILKINKAQVSNLYREYKVNKINNRYFATIDQIQQMINRKNRYIKEYDL